MDEKKGLRKGDDSGRKGKVTVVGIGPGGPEHLTKKAEEAIKGADVIVGYTRYVDLIAPLTVGKKVVSTGMTEEVERCAEAVRLAREGRNVAVVSSGDSGVYGMAGLVLKLSGSGGERVDVFVVSGVPAFVAASSLLGAPLMHDFASISLSDLLTPWEVIEERIDAAAGADFVIILYNPKSTRRVEGLGKAVEIIRRYRSPDTPVGVVRNATRDGEEASITTLGSIDGFFDRIDMLTIVIVGNSSTYIDDGRIITPRGYRVKAENA